MPTRIPVGRFGAPHGVRGELRLQSFTAEPGAIAGYGPLFARDGRRFVLAAVRPNKDDMLLVRVEGVADRDAAAALTGLELSVDRDALPPAGEDEFYIADLIGFAVVGEDGSAIGTVVDVPNYGGGDLVEVKPAAGGETLLLPFTKAVVPVVDLAARRLQVVPPDEIDGDADQADEESEGDAPEGDDASGAGAP